MVQLSTEHTLHMLSNNVRHQQLSKEPALKDGHITAASPRSDKAEDGQSSAFSHMP